MAFQASFSRPLGESMLLLLNRVGDGFGHFDGRCNCVTDQTPYKTADEVRAELASYGSDATPRSLRNWRSKGLLPDIVQRSRRRGRGTETLFPPTTAQQSVAIQKLYSKGLSTEKVGWELWVRGYLVDEKYWKPHFDKARELLTDGSAELFTDDGYGLEFSDGANFVLATVLASKNLPKWAIRIRQRLGVDAFGHFFEMLLNIYVGIFGSSEAVDSERKAEESEILRAFGIRAAKGRRNLENIESPKSAQISIQEALNIISNIEIRNRLISEYYSEYDMRNAVICIYEMHNYAIDLSNEYVLENNIDSKFLSLILSLLKDIEIHNICAIGLLLILWKEDPA